MSDFYSRNAARLAAQYEQLEPEEIHGDWIRFIPASASLILDVGAGSGRDAAWLTRMGHEVVAVEPSDGLRKEGQQRHPLAAIRWVSDTLPALQHVRQHGYRFDLILLSAVWMHLAPEERQLSLCTLGALLRPGAYMAITLRYGPSPDERVMYTVSDRELACISKPPGLDMVLNTRPDADKFERPEVSWGTVVLQKKL